MDKWHALEITHEGLFRSLPKTWKEKMMIIQEAKDLTKLPLKKLIDSLMTHKNTKEKQELEEKSKKNLKFKTMHDDDDNDKDDREDEDIALSTRQF
ncbi:hypothetical protein NC652_034660 [Populus alba x Populus x berolinensis]|nr:hypothetical protein NC652_034660 [Populus alba x Populus x berolinensis]